jgi:dipeptidyl aminopeptidase/acylaminoacyl peptidase
VRCLAASLVAGWVFFPARAELPPLIPRLHLFGDAERGTPLISPDGTHLAWLAPTNGLVNLWVRSLPVDGPTNDTKVLSLDPRGTVRQPAWQSDSQAVLYHQDSDGFGNVHVFQAHLPTGNIRDLTPFTGVQGRLLATSPTRIDEILVTLNLRDRRMSDVWRVDTRTGAVALESENTGETVAWFADPDLNLRLSQFLLPNGDLALGTRSDARSMWRPLLRWSASDALGRIVGFGPTRENVWIVSSVGAPAPSLIDVNLVSGTAAIVSRDPRCDVATALLHPSSNTIEAVQVTRSRAQWQLINTNLFADFEALRRFRDGDLDVLSRDRADRFWTVTYSSPDYPLFYALYDRANRKVVPLFDERPALAGARFGSSRPISFKARDGLPLEGYLTLPAGLEPRALPTVLLVHGGPWSRTIWGFDSEVQWLANRGYAVLQVNFRGSTGYGKDHLNAGDKEWGGKILLDLLDAKQWAVDQGYADPRRLAIMGTGFGGYAATAMLALHPDAFAAGANLAGPPNLLTMLASVPASAAGMRAVLDRRVGKPETDAALLQAHSPTVRAALIKAPLLVALPGHDPQVPVAEMDRFVTAIRKEGRNVEYFYFPDEGATLRNPMNRLRHAAAVEAFLAKHLGGRADPPLELERFESLRR